jgi:hypothetical protein
MDVITMRVIADRKSFEFLFRNVTLSKGMEWWRHQKEYICSPKDQRLLHSSMMVVWDIAVTNNSAVCDEEKETWLTKKKGTLLSVRNIEILVPPFTRVNKSSCGSYSTSSLTICYHDTFILDRKYCLLLNLFSLFRCFRSEIAKVRLLTLLCLPVCPYVTTRGPLDGFSWKFMWVSLKFVDTFWLKSYNNNEHFTRRLTCVSAPISSVTHEIFIQEKKKCKR